jgi:uncharacterized membrane-anchored protein YitT (DUF2179 family)
MNPLLYQLVQKTIEKGKKGEVPETSPYKRAKKVYQRRLLFRRSIKDWILIVAGVFSAAFGLKGFLLPNQFIDGGAVGIALLTAEVTKYPLWALLILVNVPFIGMAWKTAGRQFAVKTAVAICLLALVSALLSFPVITHEKILIAVFGGFFLGTGIGLAIRGGCVIDGTEVLAVEIGKRFGLTVGDVLTVINILIFSAAAWLLTINVALYSLLAYFSAAKAVDFVVEGVEEYIGVTIISPKTREIREAIVQNLQRGVTVYAGKKGIGKGGVIHEPDILFVLITRLEIGRLKIEIDQIDPNAFVVMQSVRDAKGGMIKKRPLPH